MLQHTQYETAASCERVLKQNLENVSKHMDFSETRAKII